MMEEEPGMPTIGAIVSQLYNCFAEACQRLLDKTRHLTCGPRPVCTGWQFGRFASTYWGNACDSQRTA